MTDFFLAEERVKCGLSTDTTEGMFSRLRPHLALESEQNEKLYLKVLGDQLAEVLLRDNTGESETARSLVASILSSIVLKNAINTLAQPWMLHDIVLKLLDPSPDAGSMPPKPSVGSSAGKTRNSLWREGETITEQVAAVYSRIIQTGSSAIAAGAKLLVYLGTMYSSAGSHQQEGELDARYIVGMLRETLSAYTQKPLAVATLSALVAPLTRGRLGTVANRIVSQLLAKTLRRDEVVARVLKTARLALFPTGYMGPPRVVPTEEEQANMRQRVLELLTKKFGRLAPAGHESVNHLLCAFDSPHINKHLVYRILELLIVEVYPELAAPAT